MPFYEKPTNTAARASSGAERTRWRDANVDPELLNNPFDVAAAVEAEKARVAEQAIRTEEMRQQSAARPLGVMVAERAMQPQPFRHDPATLAVHESFNPRQV